MSSKPEPAIWSHDTGQRIPCFDRCQLTIAWMFNIKDTRCTPRLQDLVLTRVRPPFCATPSLGALGRDPFLPWEKSCMGSYFYACMWSCCYSYGAPLGGPSGRRTSAITKWLMVIEGLTHWMPERFAKNAFLDILEICRLDMSHVISKKPKRQLPHDSICLHVSFHYGHVFYVTYVFRLLFFIISLPFLFLLLLSFCCSDWTSTGLASSWKIHFLRKHHQDGQFLPWSS